ncbi:MAG: ABC transporter permease [Oscillospiraceae bacterium]|jgi:ABC-2 type transport system permease protein
MLSIISKEVKEFLRDKSSLFFMIIFPILLIFLLGNLLSNLDSTENAIGELKVQYISENLEMQDSMIVSEFLKELSSDSSISFEETESLSAADKLVGEDQISAVVVFSGSPMKITIHQGRDNTKNRTVNAIMASFVQTNKSISAVLNSSPEMLSAALSQSEELVKQKDLGLSRTMLDYYGVAMIAMIIVMSTLSGSYAFLSERQMKTLNRLIVSPKNRGLIFIQKILGLQAQTVMQVILIMLVSTLFFNVHYAADIKANLVLFAMFFICASAFISAGVLFGLLLKANPSAALLPFLWIMLFVSGSYSKEIYIKGVTEKMPPNIIQNAAFDLTVFGRYEKALTLTAAMTVITLVLLIIGAFIFSKKEEER